jgi:chromosome segregation protein
LAQQHESAGRRLGELKAVVDGRSEGIRSYQESIKSLTAEVAESRSQIGALEQSVGELNQKADGLKQHRAKQQAELGRMEETLTGKRRDLETARSRASEMEVRLAETQVQRQNQLERATGDYRITLDQLLEEPEPDWHGEPPSLDDIETKIAELRTKIEAMGPVNLVAIDEYETQSERAEYLEKQHADLLSALDTLEKVIRKIDKETRVRFEETYTILNKNFSNYFPKLFGGGKASLSLTSDDWLTTGITVLAQPPGKRNSTIHLLSGGEKALTAVSLLFGLFELNPAPFCIMDEVDAPLDDANVDRFCDTLRSLSEHAQIIVITHNKITMQAASNLIGVTMNEPGVSRVVSVDVERALELVEN